MLYAYKKLGMKKRARADLEKSAELGFWKVKQKLNRGRKGSIF